MNTLNQYYAPVKPSPVNHWDQFRKHIIGHDLTFENEHGVHKVLYADWIASGRLYAPIEKALTHIVGPIVANPHSISSYTGRKITGLYEQARKNIKQYLNADDHDILVTVGSGMTDALLRLQDVLGIRNSGKTGEKPVVFITHMEHHSHHVSWMECNVDVVIVPPNDQNLVDPNNLRIELEKYRSRKLKIGAFSACSNVTGIINPIHALARAMHKYGGFCFIDYAASAPYVNINMHPEDPKEALDAIYFSPHKFLGGPGSCGILIFNRRFHNGTPTIPGGGNVRWTDPWGGYGYVNEIEVQEDGGTPAFLQTIKASMAIALKEKMGIEEMKNREEELLMKAYQELERIEGVEILHGDLTLERIGLLAFNIKGLHYNLVVKLLNDRFGIQVRGGWSCASTYAHTLYGIEAGRSKKITNKIHRGNASLKPGWIRLSLHPTMTNEELGYCTRAIRTVSTYGKQWGVGYIYNPRTNEFNPLEGTEWNTDDLEKLLQEFDKV